MTSEQMAHAHLRTARQVLREAELHLEDGDWNLVVRRCQESVELSLKALLRHAGLDVPKVHDVGPALKKAAGQFPDFVVGALDRLVSISRSLRLEREVSLYGDEELGVGPDALYTEVDAKKALDDAIFVLGLAQRAVGTHG